MNRILYLFIFICFPCFLFSEPLQVKVNAAGAILMNAETGAVLYEKKAHHVFHPASITKVATALYSLKLKGDCLDETVTTEADDVCAVSEEAMRKASYTLPTYWLTFGELILACGKGNK